MLPFAALSPWIVGHWLRAALLLLALAFLAVAWWRRRDDTLLWAFGLPAAGLGLLALGGLTVPGPWSYSDGLAVWLFTLGLTTLFTLAALLLVAGLWQRETAVGAAALALFGLGGLLLRGIEADAADLGQSLSEMRLRSPWWLLLLAAVPVVVVLGRRKLNRHELRPWLAMGLRVVGVTVLALALAEPFFSQASRAMTVLFVVDRSLSIPDEPGDDPAQPGVKADLRARRILRFINDSVQMRGSGHERDMAGLIVFGKRPRLDLPPSDAPRFNLKELPAIEDANYTDIGSALKLALASFPEGTARRIVLVSDGNENLGNAEEQARLAKTLSVQIDVLPLAAGRRNTEEVLVERIDAPPVIEQGARVPIRVLVRSHNPNTVVGRLTLRQVTDKEGTLALVTDKAGGIGVEVEPLAPPQKGVRIRAVMPRGPAERAGLEVGEDIVQVDGADVAGAGGLELALAKKKGGEVVRIGVRRNPVKVVAVRDPVKLQLGLNPFSFDRPITDEQRSYTYEAEFEPRGVETADGKLRPGLPGDRVQNNRASTHVVARGQGRILLLENKAGEHAELVERLVEAGKKRFKVVAEPVDVLENYRQRDQLAVFLSNFDCVILANVPADRVSEEHQEVIRSNTHDQGCGLVMIGGPEAFGAGGWQNTPVEKALPVDCDIKSLKVQGKGGLVLIMHASEMADGNRWQKKIAKLAVERLGPTDEVGILDYGFVVKWHVPMQEAGPNRAKILAAIDGMMPGDMPDFDPALKMAHDALMDKKKDFGAKHIIIISDGDPMQNDKVLLKNIKADKITIATVGVATHGAPQDKAMEDIATLMPGSNKKRYYKVTDPSKLPAIYIKETRLVSQAFVHRKEFQPILRFRTEPIRQLPDLPPLGGFVRTTAKPDPLVEVPILSPKFNDQDFPILAHWQYGLGKGVAFTSDAGRPDLWCRKWMAGDGGDGMYSRFWEQVLAWSLRPTESGRLVMTTEVRDGKVRIVVEARDDQGKPDSGLRIEGGLTPPSGKGGEPGRKKDLRFVQTNSGVYEAEVRADEAGSYFIAAQAIRKRKVKGKDGKEVEVEDRDSVRAGVTLPYSPEFGDLETNSALLDRMRELTGGREYVDDETLVDAARKGEVFREPETRTRFSLPFHYWLLFLAAGLLLLDVAVRRLAFDPKEASENAAYVWARLRGRPVPPPVKSAAVERLQARTPGAGAERRWEGSGGLELPKGTDATGPAAAVPSVPRPAASGGVPEARPAEQAGDTLDALKKAKKRVWDEKKEG